VSIRCERIQREGTTSTRAKRCVARELSSSTCWTVPFTTRSPPPRVVRSVAAVPSSDPSEAPPGSIETTTLAR